MASFANMTIADGAGTPVNRTFVATARKMLPDGRAYYSWYDTSENGGLIIGANRIELWIRPLVDVRQGQNAGSQVFACEYKVTRPTLEVLGGSTAAGYQAQPKVAFDTTQWGKFVRSGRSAALDAQHTTAFARNFENNVTWKDVTSLFQTLQ